MLHSSIVSGREVQRKELRHLPGHLCARQCRERGACPLNKPLNAIEDHDIDSRSKYISVKSKHRIEHEGLGSYLANNYSLG